MFVFAAVIIAVSVYLFLLCPITANVARRKKFFEYSNYMFAHRGLHNTKCGIPENSMPSFIAAIKKGYGIELDVRLTKDNIPVVIHDADLIRVCLVNKKVSDLTYNELSKYKLFGTNCTVPSLEQVVKTVGTKVPILIEYKTLNFNSKIYKVTDILLKKYGCKYMIQSFNPYACFWYRIFNRKAVRGLLSSDFKGEKRGIVGFLHSLLIFNAIVSPDFISYNINGVYKISFKICRYVYKIPCLGWTARTQEQSKKAEKFFDGIIFEE